MEAEFIVVSGALLGARFPLGNSEVSIGRAPSAGIRLSEPGDCPGTLRGAPIVQRVPAQGPAQRRRNLCQRNARDGTPVGARRPGRHRRCHSAVPRGIGAAGRLHRAPDPAARLLPSLPVPRPCRGARAGTARRLRSSVGGAAGRYPALYGERDSAGHGRRGTAGRGAPTLPPRGNGGARRHRVARGSLHRSGGGPGRHPAVDRRRARRIAGCLVPRRTKSGTSASIAIPWAR